MFEKHLQELTSLANRLKTEGIPCHLEKTGDDTFIISLEDGRIIANHMHTDPNHFYFGERDCEKPYSIFTANETVTFVKHKRTLDLVEYYSRYFATPIVKWEILVDTPEYLSYEFSDRSGAFAIVDFQKTPQGLKCEGENLF